MAAFSASSPLRLRAFSDVSPSTLELAHEAVMYADDAARIVIRHTFLELEAVEHHEECRSSVASCTSARGSESTCQPGDAWEATSCSAMTDDEPEPQATLCIPPGHFVPAPSIKAPRRFRSERTIWGWGKQKRRGRAPTSVVLKNLPADCTNSVILDLLTSAGLTGQYDFLYLPIDFRDFSAFGFAFVNFVCTEQAQLAMDRLSGLDLYGSTVEVSWCAEHQGCAVHVRRYRNSPVMHPSVADAYKPMIFKDGVRQSFPLPTKKVKEPRLRRSPVEPASCQLHAGL
jgi:hypothetical protein